MSEAICRKFLDAARVARDIQRDRSDYTQFPKIFTVPTEAPWPAHLQGETLFSANLRCLYKTKMIDDTTLDEFNALHFVWDPVEHQRNMEICALQAYRAVFGHVRVPSLFVVPDNDDQWPKDTWTLPLGVITKTLRSSWTSLPETSRAALEQVGIHQTDVAWPMASQVAAFKWFKQAHGHVDIPGDFVVPSQEDTMWPSTLWGLPLGLVASDLQANPLKLSQAEYTELKALGVAFEGVDTVHWDEKVQALIVYGKIYGDLLVPSRFKVPKNDMQWPNSMWGMGLGGVVSRLRRDASVVPADRYKQLLDMGFVWNMDEFVWNLKIRALETYKALYGDLKVPQVFNVPTHDSRWPPESRGYKLGRAIDRLREYRGILPRHRIDQLSAMGFVWRCRRQRQPKPLNAPTFHEL
ncbi:hypothetical protein DYB26_009629 [Aphanomyces astaci]|uniref:Helicase-associated domain-containing protein n=1 Tax=Aphanomyces astaci TaxID=112090 RepID=A0A397F038_APHAT|nr:hypothetical protein DYB34_007630 [Aphanomyces astaci]RHZ06420.1 hypothetical protein DYB31_008223 [Aphanomyces astaci]RHZ12742.1 hypothetical protein DYB26_009629 [Aphanomyces astaci]